jgi:four helix bundle protein
MATIKHFEDLDVWQKARNLYEEIIKMASQEVVRKDYRFCSQVKSAAGSVMDNIAEGFERDSRLEFIQFLSIAKGSCGEVCSQAYRAFDESYISGDGLDALVEQCRELGKDIGNFIRYLNGTEVKGQKFAGRK